MNLSILKEIRKSKKMSMEDVARSSGIDRNTVSKIEKGACMTSVNTLEAICKSLDLELRICLK